MYCISNLPGCLIEIEENFIWNIDMVADTLENKLINRHSLKVSLSLLFLL